MSQKEYQRVFDLLKPALLRMVDDAGFRERFEAEPLSVLGEMNIELSPELAAEMEGRTFSEFWSAHRARSGPRVQIRDLPPDSGELTEDEMRQVAGGSKAALAEQEAISRFAPPYVPVGPVVSGNRSASPYRKKKT